MVALRGFRQHRELRGRIGVECACRRRFGRIVHGQARPQTEGVIGKPQRMANGREREKTEGAQREDGGNGVGCVLVIGFDSALGRDNRGNAADGRSNGQQRGEFRR